MSAYQLFCRWARRQQQQMDAVLLGLAISELGLTVDDLAPSFRRRQMRLVPLSHLAKESPCPN